MSEGHKEQPIIIKKKKHGGHGHHGGAWKVAFADFMTAMMAFFLVMWLVGQDDAVKESVAGYFRDPGKFMQQGKSGILKGSQGAIGDEATAVSVVKPKKEAEYLPSEKEKRILSKAGQGLIGELKKQEAFKRLKENIKIQLTSEGLRIILNESPDAPAFFEPGSAKLLQKSAIILVTIARELGRLPNSLVLEGHTDGAYTGTREYTNWELSADRANSARALMEVSGLQKGQVREVRGFADKFPMDHLRPEDPRNRRVTILVLYQEREYQYDQIEVGDDIMAQVGD